MFDAIFDSITDDDGCRDTTAPLPTPELVTAIPTARGEVWSRLPPVLLLPALVALREEVER